MSTCDQAMLSGLVCAVMLTSCGAPDDDRPIIFAAASLAEVLQEAAAGFTAAGGKAPRLSFDATSRLARQLTLGAPADAFFSADVRWMDAVERAGRLRAETRVDLLSNRLVLAVRVGQTGPEDPAALLAQPPGRLARAGENVPAGRYADDALRATGMYPALRSRIIRGHSVRTVLEWLARGDVPMAVVYASDVHAEPRVKVAFALPASSHPPIIYVAAITQFNDPSTARGDAAAAFLRWCRGAKARAIFERAGFTFLPANVAAGRRP